MTRTQKPYAETWIESLKGFARCEWCGTDGKLNRRGLCSHCNDIHKQIEQWQKIATEEIPTATGMAKYVIPRELAIAEAKRKNCIVHGEILRAILNGEVGGLRLEHQLSYISEKMAYRDLFHGLATQLGWAFTKTERQLVSYLLWKIESGYARKNRRPIAEGIADRKRRKQREQENNVSEVDEESKTTRKERRRRTGH